MPISPHLLICLPPLFWAGNAIAGRMAIGVMPPLQLAAWRWALALVLLAPWVAARIWRDRQRLAGQGWVLFGLSLCSVTFYNSFLYMALTATTALNATLITASLPIGIMGLSRLWLKTPIGRAQAWGILVSTVGVVLVIARGEPLALLALRFHSSDLWLLAAVASWSFYSVLLRRHPTGLDGMSLLGIQVAIGFVLILPLAGLEIFQIGVHWPHGTAAWGLIAYVAVFPSLLAYGLWNYGVAQLGPNLAGLYSNLIPVFTAFLGVVVLGEPLMWFHLVALAFILGGIWAAARPRGL